MAEALATNIDVLVKINGKEVPKDEVHDIHVDKDLDQPDMAAVVLSNASTRYSEQIKEGDPIEIHMGLAGQSKAEIVFKGEIVGIEPIYQVGAPTRVVIRAFNKLHAMARGKKSVSFTGVTDKDIVERIARNYSLSCDFGKDSPSTKYDHVYQHNQTDLEFLRLRASRIGFEVSVDDAKLFFLKRTEEDSGIKLQLAAPGETNLERFLPRLSTSNQVSEVRVRGWDYDKKKEIVGTAQAKSSKLGDKTGASIASSKHSDVLNVDVDVGVHSKEEADAIARSILIEHQMSFITGEAACTGNNKLKPGIVVEVDVQDQRFNGKYYVTGTRHRYTHVGEKTGYMTEFRFKRDARGGQ